MNASRAVSATLSFWLLFPPPLHAAVDRPYRIGIVGLPESSTMPAEAEQAYEKLEKRLERWIEKEPRLSLRAQALTGRPQQAPELLIRRLDALAEQALASPTPEVLRIIEREAKEAAARFPELAPAVQRLRNAQALAIWRTGDTRKALVLLQAALRLHPEGRLAESSLPLGLSGEEKGRWNELLQKASQDLTRGCIFDLQVWPKDARLTLNGFSFGERRRLALVRGERYRAWVDAQGYTSAELALDCRRAGQWIETVRLKAGSDLDNSTVRRLRYLSDANSVSSVLLARPVQNRFGLFLYTPGFGAEKIPTEVPITFASLSAQTGDEKPPIATDVLADVLHRHRAFPQGVALAQNGEAGYDLPLRPNDLKLEPPSDAWYERRTFWVATGVVAAAVAAWLVLSHHGPSQHTNPAASIQID